MAVFANDIRMVFWFAVIPAVLAVACVLFGVEDAPAANTPTAAPPVRLVDLKRLPSAFWSVTLVGVVFTLARFSEAFLILKASVAGLPLMLAPLVLVVMNVVYALGAYPAGIWSDHVPARRLFGWGLLALIAADLSLGLLPGLGGAFLGIGLWGVHMALSQGLLAKLVADYAPAELRGSAFGVFNLMTGAAMLFASVIAGLVWDRLGADATFLVGAGFAFSALAIVLNLRNPSIHPA